IHIGLLQGFQVFRGRALCKQLTGQALELFAHPVDAVGLLWTDGLDDRSAMRDDFDQALCFKLAQRFTHQGPADARHFAQLPFRQSVSGLKAACQDGVPYAFRNAMAQHRSYTMHLEITIGFFRLHIVSLSYQRMLKKVGTSRVVASFPGRAWTPSLVQPPSIQPPYCFASTPRTFSMYALPSKPTSWARLYQAS